MQLKLVKELCLNSFRVGGRPVEGTGPSSLCSSSHRRHEGLHLLPQVYLHRSLLLFSIYIVYVWLLVCMCYCFTCTFHVCLCMCHYLNGVILRWLLLGFQREFEHSDALRLFEILSCDHLELITQQVDRARYQERLARKCSTGETKNWSWKNKQG